MFLNRLLDIQPVFQIEKNIITLNDYKQMVCQKLIEVPVVKNDKFLGILQRRTIVNKILKDEIITLDDYYDSLKMPKIKLQEWDTLEDISHKIMCTEFKIIPVFSNDDQYIGSLQTINILKQLLKEKDFVINYYENMLSDFRELKIKSLL